MTKPKQAQKLTKAEKLARYKHELDVDFGTEFEMDHLGLLAMMFFLAAMLIGAR